MQKRQWLILILILTTLIQAACTTPKSECPAETNDLKLLRSEDGYCLLYPSNYSTALPHFIVINPISAPGDMPGEAWVSINVEAATGRTASQVADAQIAEAGPGFNISRSDIMVDGHPAVVIDGLPGPDPSRRLITVSNDRLYTFTFMPWVSNAQQPTPLEGLYTTTIDSLHFTKP